ncbi:hypothetical protein ABTJ92_22185, partial [Acinetobacter baumannii]
TAPGILIFVGMSPMNKSERYQNESINPIASMPCDGHALLDIERMFRTSPRSGSLQDSPTI